MLPFPTNSPAGAFAWMGITVVTRYLLVLAAVRQHLCCCDYTFVFPPISFSYNPAALGVGGEGTNRNSFFGVNAVV